MRELQILSLIPVVSVLACGCLSPAHTDRGVTRALRETGEGGPTANVGVLSDALREPRSVPAVASTLRLDLDTSLRLATKHSREMQSRREQLYRSGMSLLGTERGFGLVLGGTSAYVMQFGAENTGTGNLDIDAGHILPTGGSLSLSGQAGAVTGGATNGTATGASVSLRVDQPLLSGAGYGASHETLVQSRRNLLYALRSFALERQDFAIGIMSGFYDLLIRQAALENLRRNKEQSDSLLERTEAMFRVQRAPAIDVLRAQQQVLSAKNELGRSEVDFDIQVRRFLLTLGVPVNTTTALVGTIPARQAVTAEEEACIDTALQMRLDLKTVRDREEDAHRRLRVTRNRLLPDVSLYGEARLDTTGENGATDAGVEDSYSAGVTLEIPLDKRDERDAVKAAQLDLAEATRDRAGRADEVRLEVRDAFSRLGFLWNSIEIEAQNIEIAERRARNAMLRFKNGELLNRDVVEAENELLGARNAHVRALVQYEIQRVTLARHMGLLDIEPEGTLIETVLDGGE